MLAELKSIREASRGRQLQPYGQKSVTRGSRAEVFTFLLCQLGATFCSWGPLSLRKGPLHFRTSTGNINSFCLFFCCAEHFPFTPSFSHYFMYSRIFQVYMTLWYLNRLSTEADVSIELPSFQSKIKIWENVKQFYSYHCFNYIYSICMVYILYLCISYIITLT